MDYTALCERLSTLAREAGKRILLAEERPDTKNKRNRKDFVTKYDKEIQEFLEKHLKEEYPEVGYLAEEGDDFGHADMSGALFVIDPIDGTTNFVRGIRVSAVSIAYAEGGQSKVGVVYCPYSDELFTAVYRKGARLNGKPIHVNEEVLGESVAAVGTSVYYEELMASTCALLSALLPKVVDIRRLGCASLDICYTAAGRFGVFAEDRLSPWDYAAGMLVLTEAGGIITDYNGNPLSLDRRPSVLCGNPKAYKELYTLMREIH